MVVLFKTYPLLKRMKICKGKKTLERSSETPNELRVERWDLEVGTAELPGLGGIGEDLLKKRVGMVGEVDGASSLCSSEPR